MCLLTGLIRAIRFEKGKIHDFQLYKQSKFDLSEKLAVKADLGFQGIQNEHKNADLPHKTSKLKPLTETQIKENKEQAIKRVPIEHTNHKCKIFKICGNRFRGKHQNYETTASAFRFVRYNYSKNFILKICNLELLKTNTSRDTLTLRQGKTHGSIKDSAVFSDTKFR